MCEQTLVRRDGSLTRCARQAQYEARYAYHAQGGLQVQRTRLCFQHARRLQAETGCYIDALYGPDRTYLDLTVGQR